MHQITCIYIVERALQIPETFSRLNIISRTCLENFIWIIRERFNQ